MSHVERKTILRACHSALIPIARFLLRSGISFREFAEIARVAFVEVATEDYGIRGRPTNISRVAAMTGITRKDVRRVRLLTLDYEDDFRVALSPLGDMLLQWHTNPTYLDVHCRPRALPMNGPAPSFEDLVQKSAKDLPAGAMKVELMRLGAIRENSDGTLSVVRREIVPADTDERLVTSIAFSLRALATTIAFNTAQPRTGPGRIERFVQSEPLTDESRQKLYGVIRNRIGRFAEECDNIFSQGERARNEGRRIGVGIYYHEDSD